MNIEHIKTAYAEALQTHHQLQPGQHSHFQQPYYGPSLDALFIAAYLDQRKRPYAANDTPPAWFVDGVAALEYQHATATAVLQQLGKVKPSVKDAQRCGIWLRSMGYKSRKTNGRVMFMIQR